MIRSDQQKAQQTAGKWPVLNAERIPVVLYFDFFAAARQGVSPRRFIDDPIVKRNAVVETFLETGADSFVIGRLPSPFSYAAGGFPNRIRLPGQDLPETSMWQFEECEETIFVEDYDYIASQGWNSFLEHLLPRFAIASSEDHRGFIESSQAEGLKDLEAWKQADVQLMCGAAVTAPFEVLTAGRTMFNFFEDLLVRPGKVMAALEGMLPDFIGGAIEAAYFYGNPAVVITAHRSCGSLISPRHFEQFSLPFLRKMVDAFYQAGLNVMLHLDCDWTKNLPYLKEFPPGMIIHTDGSTDLLKAKKVLKDKFILMGDVPALLLARGSPEEVKDYCLSLVEAIGRRGEFILSSGCDVPMDAKMENVQAMIKAVQR